MKMLKRSVAVVLAIGLMALPWTSASASGTYNAWLRPVLCGDMNKDGRVDMFDAFEMYLCASGKTEWKNTNIADMNKDGYCTIDDALRAFQIASGQKSTVKLSSLAALTDTPMGGEQLSAVLRESKDYMCKKNELFVAQSKEDLYKVYLSRAAEWKIDPASGRNDFSADYDEAFFEENAVIVATVTWYNWPDDFVVNGLYRDGATLELRTTVYDDCVQSPAIMQKQLLFEVAKADLVGIEQVRICREYIEAEMPD